MRTIHYKYLTIYTPLLLVFLTIGSNMFAQQTELKIIDLSIQQKSIYAPIDTINFDITENLSDTLLIFFKMNRADLAQNVNILFGTKDNESDIKRIIYPVVKESNSYFVQGDFSKFEII